MKKYKIILTKRHEYIVEANGIDSAIDMAMDMDEDKSIDIQWVTDPIDEITAEEVNE